MGKYDDITNVLDEGLANLEGEKMLLPYSFSPL